MPVLKVPYQAGRFAAFAAAAGLLAAASAHAQDLVGDWRSFAADPASTKYSGLDQITPDNIDRIEPVWTWDAAALDATTGQSPRGAPMTYLHGGRQYLVFAVGGGDSPPGLRSYAVAE